ncbi:alpha-hydroxy-acid oxidizing protein [Anaerobacillus alkaliphilus]|uniref:L-lactate oxidase n=1 Tax=Anaerobacillus alkaliphilus TaxID=1548597 RepID=A0A4Q0VXY7_9BACI|nr:alpha-hydroxy-acid oxidizing protein [Anaerobacillus alkaliphilus]RXJ04607.1 alpha-hydroxy-acid oxidizing protein [Anaerobacillus alkaliphilus]
MGSVDLSTLKVVEEWERKAKEILPKGAYDYVNSGSGKEETSTKNVQVFSKWSLVPRMLRNVKTSSLATKLWGVTLATPVMLAPVGFQTVIHPSGELAAAKASDKLGIPYITSTVSSYNIEAIALAAPTTPKFFQLYWPGDDEIAVSFVRRAEQSGYTAIVLTVDTSVIGYRERDLQNQYFPLRQGAGMANYLSDPIFQKKYNAEGSNEQTELIGKIAPLIFNQTLTWEKVAWLKTKTSLPVIIKGILHPADAKLAKAYGVDGVVVSNHGGRQLDGAISSLEALPAIAKELKGEMPIFFDGGIRRGSDIIKALALGADFVCVGRLYAYGLAFGVEGVYTVLKNLISDLDVSLALTGVTSISEVDDTIIVKNT